MAISFFPDTFSPANPSWDLWFLEPLSAPALFFVTIRDDATEDAIVYFLTVNSQVSELTCNLEEALGQVSRKFGFFGWI